METKQKRTKVVVSVLALAALVVFSLSGYAGKLEPSGPPGPTMKTLDEVEPRITVQSLPGDANALYVISQPGSYYLKGNITGVTGKSGIEIKADNVVLDLSGFQMIGVADALDGIRVVGERNSIAIKNGSIRQWGESGIDAVTANNTRIKEIQVKNTGLNSVAGGIGIGSGVISDCTVTNGGACAIAGADSTLIQRCNARNSGHGIFIIHRGEILDCVAVGNGVGIVIQDRGIIARCHSADNAQGIVPTRCYVYGNQCSSCGDGGIIVTFSGSRIEENSVVACGTGIRVEGTTNIILRNTASGNTTNYNIAAGNSYGPIINVADANDISTVSGADHPWANFEF